MQIAIFGRSVSKPNREVFKQLIKSVTDLDGSLIVHNNFARDLSEAGVNVGGISQFKDGKELKGRVNCLFSIGGDGTLLNTTPLIRDSEIPVLGINTGRLGFLSSIQTEELEEALKRIMKADYFLDKRVLLQLNEDQQLFGEQNYALNEFTVIKKDTSSMISIEVYLNDKYLNTYWADGLIVATPTGSTAYSLSCGGPIVVPGSGNFTITPIAPHNLNVRPIVIPDHYRINLKLISRAKNHLISLDSRSVSIAKNQKLEITRAKFSVNLIRMEEYSFFNTLRSKLNWGLDKRN